MDTEKGFVKGQKVITDAGEGAVEEINGNQVKVKLSSGETKAFDAEEIEDDSDAG